MTFRKRQNWGKESRSEVARDRGRGWLDYKMPKQRKVFEIMEIFCTFLMAVRHNCMHSTKLSKLCCMYI